MKIVVLAAGVLLVASGCATRPLVAEDVDGRVVCDQDRMAQIEANARKANTEIRWISCPTATLRVVRNDSAPTTTR